LKLTQHLCALHSQGRTASLSAGCAHAALIGDSGGVVEPARSALPADSFIAASLSAATAPSPRAAPAGAQVAELRRGLPPDDAVRAAPAGHAHAAPHPPRIVQYECSMKWLRRIMHSLHIQLPSVRTLLA